MLSLLSLLLILILVSCSKGGSGGGGAGSGGNGGGPVGTTTPVTNRQDAPEDCPIKILATDSPKEVGVKSYKMSSECGLSEDQIIQQVGP
jgi:hypothetical protein